MIYVDGEKRVDVECEEVGLFVEWVTGYGGDDEDGAENGDDD